MKKLKQPTTAMLMATLIFSNTQLYPIYGYEVKNTEENESKQILQNNKNIKYQNNNSKETDKNEIINIPDINLKKTINEALNKHDNLESDISKSELEHIKSLHISNPDIKNLEGIQYCINLTELYINISKENNNTENIKLLSGLTNLKSLDLADNNINDIDALSKLTNLENLNLAFNSISNIDALVGLTNLEDITLGYNRISNIDALSKLTNLKLLQLSSNKISDITPLQGLNGQQTTSEDLSSYSIFLDSNPLNLKDSETIEVIESLKDKGYKVYYDEDSNIEEVINIPDSNLKKAINYELGKNPDADITKSELETIESLNLDNRDIKTLEGIQYCINLTDLDLSNNKISDISALSNLTNLFTLNLSNNEISDISPLSELSNIHNLYLNNNKINEIKSLSQLTKLWWVDLNNNKISDISPLADNDKSFHYLDLSNNKISDITSLSNIFGGSLMEGTINKLKLFGNPLDLNDSKTKEVIKNLWINGFSIIYREEPIILAEDKVIMVGDTFDELTGISAEDVDGSDITDRIEIKENTVDTSNVGVYKVVYEVYEVYDYTQEKTIKKEIKVTVTNKIEGSTIEQGNGTESSPLVLLLQEENAIDELFNKIEGRFEYNIIDEPIIEGDYKIYKIKLNDKTIVANNQLKMNVNSSYIQLKVLKSKTNLINKLDKIFIENNNGSNEEDIVPPSNGGDSIPPIQKPVELNDIKGHWAEETIRLFIDKKFIEGYEDNTFKPNNNITRAEFVKVVNKVFGYTQKGEEQFTDVNKDDWFYDDICIGIKAGYIKGKSTDIFAPKENITREEVAMILTNIMKNKDDKLDKLNTFKDGDKTSQWAKSSVEGSIEAGYLKGYHDKTIRANSNITRAEAISMLSRVNL